MFDIDTWLEDNEGASIDDYIAALILDELEWKKEKPGVFIDDHLLSYISAMERSYRRKYSQSIDYMGLLSGHDLNQNDVYAILMEIIKTGESFLSGYIRYKRK